MEHLRCPQNTKIPRLRIPFVGPHTFDGGDFLTYPERNQWKIKNTVNELEFTHRGVQPQAEQLSNFIQQWLYFGLLKEVVGGDTLTLSALESFVVEDGQGTTFLNSSSLETAIIGPWSKKFVAEYWTKTDGEFLNWGEHITKCLLESRAIVLRALAKSSQIIDPLIFMGIALLAEYITVAVKSIYVVRNMLRHDSSLAHKLPKNQSPQILSSPVRQTWRVPSFADCGRPILQLMLENGWCPYDVARFNHQVEEVGVLWYYANLEPPRTHRDHTLCSEETCFAMQTKRETYPLAHWELNCTCALMDEHTELVNEILKDPQDGSLPLIDYTWTKDCTAAKLHVVSKESNPEFVAISHVWSDGFGNPKVNALHTCVFTQICRIVEKLPKTTSRLTTPFWMDTICVPLAPKEMKRIALNKLRDPYIDAQHVLVIDNYLRGTQSYGLSDLEIFARISCTTWAQRLWTFQEGRLGKRVWFCFADRVLELNEVYSTWANNFNRIPASPNHSIELAIICGYSASRVRGLPSFQDDAFENIGILREALNSRLVSYTADEALCLGSLMAIDMKLILGARRVIGHESKTKPKDKEEKKRMEKLKGEARMCIFWRLVSDRYGLPAGLAFSRVPQKLKATGYHWAPTTLLGFLPSKRWAGGPKVCYKLTAKATDNGLEGAYPGFILSESLIRTNLSAQRSSYTGVFNTETKQFLFRDYEADAWYCCTLLEAWASNRGDPKGYQRLAVILPTALKTQAESHTMSDSFQMFDSEWGVLACIQNFKDNEYIVEAHNHILLEQFGSTECKILRAASRCADRMLISCGVSAEEGSRVVSVDEQEVCLQTSRSFIEEDPELRVLCTSWAAHHNRTSEAETWIFEQFYFLVKGLFRLGRRNAAIPIMDDQKWCID